MLVCQVPREACFAGTKGPPAPALRESKVLDVFPASRLLLCKFDSQFKSFYLRWVAWESRHDV